MDKPRYSPGCGRKVQNRLSFCMKRTVWQKFTHFVPGEGCGRVQRILQCQPAPPSQQGLHDLYGAVFLLRPLQERVQHHLRRRADHASAGADHLHRVPAAGVRRPCQRLCEGLTRTVSRERRNRHQIKQSARLSRALCSWRREAVSLLMLSSEWQWLQRAPSIPRSADCPTA